MPQRKNVPQPELRRMVDRLRALSLDPPKQRAYAFELLQVGVPSSLLPTVIEALGPPFDAETRPLFIDCYLALAKQGSKGDPGGELRGRLVDAIAHNALSEDSHLFRNALAVRESSMQLGNGPAALHAAALRGLQVVAPDEAAAVAVQLMSFYLVDQPYPQPPMRDPTPTGEPLISALRVLFALGQDVSILQWALLDVLPAPAKGEALRLLVNLPPDILAWLVERFHVSPADEVAAGALDLALASPGVPGSEDAVRRALVSFSVDLAAYVSMSIAALRDPHWLELLFSICEAETQDRDRLTVLVDALRAVPGHPRASQLRDDLDRRVAALRAAESTTPGQHVADADPDEPLD